MKQEKEGKCECMTLSVLYICTELCISELILTAQVIWLSNPVRAAFHRCKGETHITGVSPGCRKASKFLILGPMERPTKDICWGPHINLLCLTFQVKFSKRDRRQQNYLWSVGLVLPVKKKIRGWEGQEESFYKRKLLLNYQHHFTFREWILGWMKNTF